MKARQAAFLVLERCRKDGAWASAAVDTIIRDNLTDKREAALASAIAFGTLQNLSYFDYLISCFCTTKIDKLEGKVLTILRIGVCQLALLDRIPERAAVNETVALCDLFGLARAKSLVNAVLRRIAAQHGEFPAVPGEGSAKYLAVRYSHPLWFAEQMISEKGYAFSEAFFKANHDVCGLDIQVNTLRVTAEEFRRMLDRKEINYHIPPFPNDCFSLDGGTVEQLPGYEEGLFYVQDRAAREAVKVAGIQPGAKILDACACPGGKSFAAAIDMKGRGSILACDIHEKKLSLVHSGANRLGIDILQTACLDARSFIPSYREAFDTVIADVPCSGLGVIRKKPEIRQKRREDISGLPTVQRNILENLSRYVRPGGILLYSTCTVLHEENEDVISSFLGRHHEFSPCDFSVGERKSSGGCYTFWPHIDGTDGFFVSKLVKEA